MLDVNVKFIEEIDLCEVFGFDSDMKVKGFVECISCVFEIDLIYKFDFDIIMVILVGFVYNCWVMIQGYYGIGKLMYIEQVVVCLNWFCVCVNFDSYVLWIDLIGKDVIKLVDGKQVIIFYEGILFWVLCNLIVIVFDEYDVGCVDVMFVIQCVLEVDGKLMFLDQNEVIMLNFFFWLFVIVNIVGLGDMMGFYYGMQQINQGQMDCWLLVLMLNYLLYDVEVVIVLVKNLIYNIEKGCKIINQMVMLVDLICIVFMQGDLLIVMSFCIVIVWVQNVCIFVDNVGYVFCLIFLNKCDELECQIVVEFYQCLFDEELLESVVVKVG